MLLLFTLLFNVTFLIRLAFERDIEVVEEI